MKENHLDWKPPKITVKARRPKDEGGERCRRKSLAPGTHSKKLHSYLRGPQVALRPDPEYN
jgi:hypothetical protein